MKLCSRCNRTYRDESLNYCLDDGTPLVVFHPTEEPTLILNSNTAATAWRPGTVPGSGSEPPVTRYAKSGPVNIAYQIVGEGPIDLVYVPGWVSHLEYGWESPLVANFYLQLASFTRLILFDKRGTGLSDQTSELPTLEQRMDDVRAVMEAADSSRAVLFGMSEGGNMSLLFAATYPERTIALITFGAFAKRVWSPDYPWAPTPEQRQKFYDAIEAEWGGPVGLEDLAPSLAKDEAFRSWWATYQRRSVSPRAALALARMNTFVDVCDVLPAIRVPTLVLHRTHDHDSRVEEGRYIASKIPGARFVELPGDDHLIYAGDQTSLINEVRSFVQEAPRAYESEAVLATVLCAQLGVSPSQSQAEAVDRFYALARRETDWFKGKSGVSEPDRFLASFDGPERAARCGCALSEAASRLGIEVRIGIHTGLCNQSANGIGGPAAETSCRIAGLAQPSEVLVSDSVKDLVSGAPLKFEERSYDSATENRLVIYATQVAT